MDCEIIVRDEIAERYLRRELSDREQTEYEQHFFECSHCAGELTRLQTVWLALLDSPLADKVQQPASRALWRRPWPSLAMLAMAASVAGVVLLLRTGQEPERVTHVPIPVAQPGPAAQAPPVLTPTAPPVVATSPAPARAPAEARKAAQPVDIATTLRRLAQFQPPTYPPAVLRGVADDASARFRDGMTAYAAGDHGTAVDELGKAAALDPSRPDIAFFLGISSLVSGRTAEGKVALQRTVDMGESPFLGDAHFFLAKACLGETDIAAARRHLRLAARIEGSRQREANELLEELDKLAGH